MEQTEKNPDVSKESAAFPVVKSVNPKNIQCAGQNRTRKEHPGDKMRERSSPRDSQQGTGADSARGISSFMGRFTARWWSDPVANEAHPPDTRPHSDRVEPRIPNHQVRVPQAPQGQSSSGPGNTHGEERRRYDQQIREREAQILHAQHTIETISQDAATEIKRLEKELNERDHYLHQQGAELRRLDTGNQQLLKELSAMSHRSRQLESMIADLQGNALDSLAGSKGYAPKEDRVIRDEMSKLGEKMRNWARKHGATSLSELSTVSQEEKGLIMKQLREFTSQTDWDALISRIPFSPSRIPALLVQSMLAKDTFERMFGDPFFVLTRLDGELKVPDPKEIMRLYDTMRQVDEADAHIWRSNTLQKLSKSSSTDSKSFVQQRVDRICNMLAGDFMSGPVRMLLRPVTNSGSSTSRMKELLALYIQAAQLASSLWAQRTYMACCGQQRLPVFHVADPAMSAHRLHQLDEDDVKLDDKTTLLVVQPAIIAFGSENAEYYDRPKIWAPAIVVVDEK